MTFFLLLAIFLLGASVGSFLNVLVWRERPVKKKKKLSWWRGRSVCDSCGKDLRWWENIPLVSFLFLKGRCRTCHSPIAFEYFLVEFGTGLIYLLVFFNLPPISFLLSTVYCLLTTILIFIFLYDLHYQIIPDWSVLGLVLLTLAGYLFHPRGVPLGHLRGEFGRETPSAQLESIDISNIGSGLLAGLSAAGFFLFLHLITKGRGMGLGDVKFAFFMGLFLGPSRLVLALYFAFLTGAVIGVILILLGRKRFGQHIPFGPFLAAGTFFSWLWGDSVINFLAANFFL